MLLPLATLFACADPWEEARAACELDEPLPWEALGRADDGGLNGLSVSTTCGETLLGHLGGDAAALLRDLGGDPDLGAHIEAVRTGARPIDGVAVATWGLVWLAGGDYGAIAGVEAGAYVSEGWVERADDGAERLGLGLADPLSHVLYDDVVRRAAGVSFLPDDSPVNVVMGMRTWPSDVLHVAREVDPDLGWVVEPWAPDSAAASLYHEAWHANLDGFHHVDCAPPASGEGRNCDEDLDGAEGAGFLVRWSEARAVLGGECLPRDYGPETYLADSIEEDIRASWSLVLMSELPASPLDSCE